ncbi:MAG: hypothetical protein ACR2NU_00190 [Aeoliella sp.]
MEKYQEKFDQVTMLIQTTVTRRYDEAYIQELEYIVMKAPAYRSHDFSPLGLLVLLVDSSLTLAI